MANKKKPDEPAAGSADLAAFVSDLMTGLSQNALQFAANTTRGVPGALANVLMLQPGAGGKKGAEFLGILKDTGAYVRDAREVAGLTVEELGQALNLADDSLLEAVESGSATLSFDLVLRLAALLARHDPLPFVLKLSRAYSPQAWNVLDNWGIGKIPRHAAREREFVNIYRGNDLARELSDEQFAHVVEFMRKGFDLAMSAYELVDVEEDDVAEDDDSED